MLVTQQVTGAGGIEYTFHFIGLRDLAGREDTLIFASRPDDTDDAADTDQSDFRTTLARQTDDDWNDEEDADPDEAPPTRPRGGPGVRA